MLTGGESNGGPFKKRKRANEGEGVGETLKGIQERRYRRGIGGWF